MTEYKNSNAGIIKAVPKTADNQYGIIEVDVVPAGRPTMVVLGGELTYIPRFANHYLGQIRRVLEAANVTGAELYSVYYEFGSRDADIDRINLFRRAKRKLLNMKRNRQAMEFKTEQMATNEPNPVYLDKLYNAIMRPIIFDNNTQTPYDVQTAAKNASLLRFYTHSHGGAAVTELGAMMAKDMRKMGFTNTQIKNILQNVVVIQHAPITTLENPLFTTLTFASASDTRMNLYNLFSEFAYENAMNMYPSYFSQNGAHLFAAGQIMSTMAGEHDNAGLIETARLTDDGKVIMAAERNAIINSMQSAIDGNATPTVDKLVGGDGVDWDDLVRNGNWFYDNMLKNIKRHKKRIPAPDYQK